MARFLIFAFGLMALLIIAPEEAGKKPYAEAAGTETGGEGSPQNNKSPDPTGAFVILGTFSKMLDR